MAGVYIHIPFCKKRCIYCDFYSTTRSDVVDRYVCAVVKECALRSNELIEEPVTTLYVGGGTPSQLSVGQWRKLVDGLKRELNLLQLEEFTVEVNPDDVTTEYVSMLKELGVNRVSMGVQSFIDSELTLINRRHDSRTAIDAVRLIRNAGIDNISIDLIYGIPRQTVESWRESVKWAISLNVNHISAYNLTYEHGTALSKMLERGEIKEVSEADCVKMYNVLVKELTTVGYNHYEVSNFALPGYHSRHNSAYWQLVPYLGLGAAAHGYTQGTRRNNVRDLNAYIHDIEDGKLPITIEQMEWWEQYDEVVMVMLRTSQGVDLKNIRARFGDKVCDRLIVLAQKYVADGKLQFKSTDHIALTEQGVMISDYIIRELMWDAY